MILHDISKGVFSSQVYPGDPEPSAKVISSIQKGDDYNLSQITFCPHTGTHIDAPLHFVDNGTPVNRLKLRNFYGKCTVVTVEGDLTGQDMDEILPYCHKRVLFKGNGNAFLTITAAETLVDHNIKLVGTDANTIGSDLDNNKTHTLLLENGIPILECLNLSKINDGDYNICAFPVKIEAVEAAPCRAVLLEQEKGI